MWTTTNIAIAVYAVAAILFSLKSWHLARRSPTPIPAYAHLLVGLLFPIVGLLFIIVAPAICICLVAKCFIDFMFSDF